MRATHLLLLPAIGTAFVIPDQEVFSSLAVENTTPSSKSSWLDSASSPHEAWEIDEETVSKTFNCAKNTWENAVNHAEDYAVNIKDNFQEAFAGESWLESADYETDLFDRPPHHGPHHPHEPHHPPHHGKPSKTVYELINESKYTTKLAKLINENEELVTLLNGTTSNFTIFAPIDSAFAKIPDDHKEPSKEFIEKLLTYHISPEFYPAGRVLVSRTIPTALGGEYLGGAPQRLSTQISLRGLTVNFYARIVAIDIFGTNGVIHGLGSILLPPPITTDIISFLPSEFSTLELGLLKTGLIDHLNKPSTHVGGTLFAPSNFAFQRLGPRINAFLFSKYGEKYLAALLKYHVVSNYTLYSDAFYKHSSLQDVDDMDCDHRIPKGVFHVDLPTLLDDKSLSIDVARYARFITIKINGFNRVAIPDGIAADGVIHVVPTVLIPPRTPGAQGVSAEGMELEEFMERLEPFVELGDVSIEL
ncbi:hypothetical protein EPUS_04897 [Endocarpon pusillum Z07020]|uniref:FAS1 domain-containing protein n=1 Tax=Endocarpon pusillum (strain Z07020 / HMAS-L-300199) TaxID=1263415 RepID=U1GQW4_ENDPU|nr:uncharacterized protein EPUS_04897 [Endocarpon pusillum Z07020]ERF74728.1 hypothetical protein EPUS_04897 [Endocarpon pusillum Z07020]